MAAKSAVRVDLKKLTDLYESLKTKPHIEVGVFSGKNARDDSMTNATLAAVHELGAPEHGLPARSMLRVPLSDHASEIMASIRGGAQKMLLADGPLLLWKTVGIACEKVVSQAFDTGGFGKWAPLKYETLLAKLNVGKNGRSLKKRKSIIGQIYTGQVGMGILIRTGELSKAFSSRVRMSFR